MSESARAAPLQSGWTADGGGTASLLGRFKRRSRRRVT